MTLWRRLVSQQRGEDTVEYALVLTLVSLVAVAAIGIVGDSIDEWWQVLSTFMAAIVFS